MRTSRYLLRAFAIAGGLAAALAVAPAASADPPATRVFTLTPSTHGNPEGVASAGGGAFFVGATGDGTIYRGSCSEPDRHRVHPRAPPASRRSG